MAGVAASIERDPAAAARAAAEIADDARATSDWATASAAEATRGRALRMLGEMALAEQPLRAAVDAARQAADTELEADAQIALGGVLSAMGRHDEAFEALDVARTIGSPPLQERATLQRAAVCRDVRRLDESLALFDSALPALRAGGRELDLARVQANRGGILLFRGDPFAAIPPLEESARLLAECGHEFVRLQVLHDLGCAVAHTGDLPRALDLFDEASAGMAALGHDASLPLLSRAEVLLRAGLSSDARDAAADAVRRLDAEGNGYAAAQALVALAEASRLDGDDGAALAAATRAARSFAEGGAAGWAGTAGVEVARTRFALGEVTDDDIAHLRAISGEHAAIGDLRSEVATRCLTALVASALDRHEVACVEITNARSLAARSPLVEFDIMLHTADAATALATGDLDTARRSTGAALDAIQTANSLFRGAANAALATEGRAVADIAVRLAAAEDDPLQALGWFERVLAVSTGSAAAVPADAGTDLALTHLRTITGELRRAERDGAPTEELRSAQVALESRLRDTWLRRAGSRGDTPRFDPCTLGDLLDRRAIVSIVIGRSAAFAVVIDPRGTRRIDLGDGAVVRSACERAVSAYHGIVTGGAPAVAAARRRAFVAATAALDATLLTPLGIDADEVVLVVPPAIAALPWAATATLLPRRFSLVPSVAWWQRAAASPPTPGERALVVAGPRLTGADTEVADVAAVHASPTVLHGTDAGVAAVLAELPHHDVAHIAAHGRFRHDNPMWSTIELADGPLSMFELQSLGGVPRTFVVATCDSALSGSRASDDLQGLAGTLLGLGATTVVASIGALPDDEATRATMVAVHRDLLSGVGPAESLRRRRAGADASTISATDAALVTFGVGS